MTKLFSIFLFLVTLNTFTLTCPGLMGPAIPSEAPKPYAWPEAIFPDVVRTSQYLTMRDGVKIAIDLFLPEGLKAGDKLPCIVLSTRYWRSIKFKPEVNASKNGLKEQGIEGLLKRLLVTRGYAWVEVDARGSGASFGNRVWDLDPLEVADGAEIADWIVKQPWSSGRIATAGSSYTGGTAFRYLVNRHPAVKAAVVMNAEFDNFVDNLLPGGVPHSWWFDDWGRYTADLDRNVSRNPRAVGVRPVDEDPDGTMLAAAIADHRDNYSYRTVTPRLVFRDEIPIAPADLDTPGKKKAFAEAVAYLTRRFGPNPLRLGMDIASPHGYIEDVNAGDAAVYSYDGWFDGAYQRAAIRRHLNLKNPRSRLILGPWDHNLNNPYRRELLPFDHFGEIMKFLDYHLKGIDTGIAAEKRIHYYTINEDRWKATDVWPVPATQVPLFFASGGALSVVKPGGKTDADAYQVDFTHGTGKETRWNTLAGVTITNPYPDRIEQDKKLLTYDSPVLAGDVEMTGHPLVTLHVASTATDGAFFVYLEDIDEKGRITHVTEGLLRALHRKIGGKSPYADVVPYHSFRRKEAAPLVPGEPAELTFDLLPSSYLFKKGHRIRVAVAGADKDHFALIPETPPAIRVFRNGVRASRIVLPIVMPEGGAIAPAALFAGGAGK